jgi:hypothetical protein
MARGLFVSHWGRDVAIAVAALIAGYFIFSPSKPATLISATKETAPAAPSSKPALQLSTVSAAAIAAILVDESRRAYYATGHPCACPDDLMRNGRRCGGNSAYTKRGGAPPYCYVSDVPPSAIERHRSRLAASPN